MDLKIALLGFGNVNQALAQLILRKVDALKADFDLTLTVVGISTHSHGTAINPDGIDLQAALDAYDSSLDVLNVSDHIAGGEPTTSAEDFIANVDADLLVECTWMDPQTGQPATDYCRAGLQKGMHVVTANKGPVAFGNRELRGMAKEKGIAFFFESTVMDGGPVHAIGREALPVAVVERITGVLNSTTNSILDRLEQGMSFADALKEMQDAGLAESNPSNDVDGWDSSLKISVLANTFMGADLRPQDVDRTGISGVTIKDAQGAFANGGRIKLLCEAWRDGDEVKAKVSPVAIPLSDPLAHVMRTSSAVTINTDTLPGITLVEGDSSPHTTAYGVLADIINVVRGRHLG